MIFDNVRSEFHRLKHWSRAGYKRQLIRSSSAQPTPELIMIYCKLDPRAHISMKSTLEEDESFNPRKCI